MNIDLNPFKRFNGDHVVVRFDSPGEAIRTVSDMSGQPHIATDMRLDARFYSRETWSDLENKCYAGDKETAKRGEKLMKEIEQVSYETQKRQRVASPFGRVSVGAYLASDPMPCRRKVKKPSNSAPLSIVVSLNSMAQVKAGDLEKRGIAIAALVRRLVVERPVSLYLSRFSSVSGVNSCALVKFPTAPLDSYRLAWLLSSQGFARGFGFAFHCSARDFYKLRHSDCRDVSNSMMIMFAGGTGYSQSRLCQYSDDLKEYLGTDMLYVPGSDPSNPDFRAMVSNPVAWINETVKELTKEKEHA